MFNDANLHVLASYNLKNEHFKTVTAPDRSNRFRHTETCPAHCPLLGNMRRYKQAIQLECYSLRLSQAKTLMPCVNIRTALSIALTNRDCKGFSITHIFIFYHILPC
jgi:hypothetical protein